MQERNKNQNKRILLLTTARSYRNPDFLAAAEKLGIEIVQGIDMPRQLTLGWQDNLALDFSNQKAAVQDIVNFSRDKPLDAVLAVDDSGSLLAALASAALGLPHNSPQAAEAARNKYRMRQLLQRGGVPSPESHIFSTADNLSEIVQHTQFPCVVKPPNLNGSRGVIRANNPEELESAIRRTTRLMRTLQGNGQELQFLVEDYIPGIEVALEGLLDQGQLHNLAIYDKPDPLIGPFFEETIYITPSRLIDKVQDEIKNCAARAADALGLRSGPVHAELRVNDQGPWIVEVAGRSIGGLCSRTLQFGTDTSLEELILRQACGLPINTSEKIKDARGVMMIPIPESGLFRGVEGIEEAKNSPLIENIEITAFINYPILPLPEGDGYLGFIFSRGQTPESVEAALRNAHQKLRFQIDALLPVLPQ